LGDKSKKEADIPKNVSLVIIAIGILFITSILVALLDNPSTTGLVVGKGKIMQPISLNQEYSDQKIILTNLSNITSITVSGYFYGEGASEIYANTSLGLKKIMNFNSSTYNETYSNQDNRNYKYGLVGEGLQQELQINIQVNASIPVGAIEFSEACTETCDLNNIDVYNFIISNNNSKIFLTTIKYSQGTDDLKQAKPFKDQTISINRTLKLDLSTYFTGNNISFYAYPSIDYKYGINDEGIMTFEPLKEGIWPSRIYAQQGDEELIGEFFFIKVVDEQTYQKLLAEQAIEMPAFTDATSKIDPEVLERLKAGEQVRVIVKTKQKLPIMDVKENRATQQEGEIGPLGTRVRVVNKEDLRQRVNNESQLNDAVNKKFLDQETTELVEIKKDLNDVQAFDLNNATWLQVAENDDVEEIILDKVFSSLTLETLDITKINEIQSQEYTGTGEKICVVDTGLNYNLFNLTPGVNIEGKNVITGNETFLDDQGHGTQVTYPILMSAPDSKLIIAKAINEYGQGYASDIIAGLEYCEAQNVDIISLSIGAGGFDGYCDEDIVSQKVNQLADAGIIIFAGTGNEGTEFVKAPACASKAIPVASSTKHNTIAAFSNYNDATLLVTPGQEIQTKRIDGATVTVSGTSMSVPFVAGAAADLLEDGMNYQDMKRLLVNTGDVINESGRYFSQLNAYNALIKNYTNNLTEGYLGFVNGTAENYTTLSINTCQDLNVANTGYTLNESVSINDATCFTVSADNVTLDCAGFSVTGNGWVSPNAYTQGVYSNRSNTTVQNCNINDFYRSINFENNLYGLIQEVNVSSGVGISILNNSNVHITLSNISSNSNAQALSIGQSSNVFVDHSNIVASFNNFALTLSTTTLSELSDLNIISNESVGVFIGSSNNNIFTRINVTSYIHPYWIDPESSGNNISDGNINTNSTVFIQGGGNALINNTFKENSSIWLQGSYNLFYYNNFSSNNSVFVNDAAGGNYFNTTISGSAVGNFWPNVLNGSVEVKGMVSSTDFPGYYYGSSGAGYPYNSVTSQGKVTSGVIDYGPLTTQQGTGAIGISSCGVAGVSFENNRDYVLLNSVADYNSTCFDMYDLKNVTFDCQGYTLDGLDTDGTYGFYLSGTTTNVTIKNCKLTDFYHGIYMYGSNVRYNKIQNVTVDSSKYDGIRLYSSRYNTITNVTSSNNNYGGIYLQSAQYNNISNSSLIHNSCGMIGDQWWYYNMGGIILQSSPYTFVYNNSVTGNCRQGITMWSSSYNNITSNNLTNTIIIVWETSSNNIVDNNYISGAQIQIEGNDHNIIRNNTVVNTWRGFWLIPAWYLKGLTNNTFENNKFNCTQGYSCSYAFYIGDYARRDGPIVDNKFINNTIQNAAYGFYLEEKTNNQVFIGNKIINSSSYGIYIKPSSYSNYFHANENNIDYAGFSQRFVSTLAQNVSSSENKGWWPVLDSDGTNVTTQTKTAWYDGISGGENADGTPNSSLKYWYNNQILLSGCTSLTSNIRYNYVVGNDLTSISTTCFDINGQSNIDLNCQGITLSGTNTLGTYGIRLLNSQNISIRNCNIEKFYNGIYFSSSSNNQVANLAITNSTMQGIFLGPSSSNNYFEAVSNELDYINDSSSKFYSISSQNTSSTLNLGWWPTIYSDGQGITQQDLTAWYNYIYGANADLSSNESLTTWYGGITSGINTCNPLLENDTSYNLLGNLTNKSQTCLNINDKKNVVIDCQNNLISGENVLGTSAIILNNSENITIKNCILQNFDKGIVLDHTIDSNIESNEISSLSEGIDIDSFSSNNLFYANSNNYDSIQNTTLKIISFSNQNLSSQLNYGWWPELGNLGGTVQTVGDTVWYGGLSGGRNSDLTLNISLAYWYNNSITQEAVCLNNYESNKDYFLTIDVENYSKTCIHIVGQQNITLDCQGKTISGINMPNSYGLHIDANSKNITVKNCNFKKFDRGITLSGSTDNSISNITSGLNDFGVYVDATSHRNHFENMTLYNNTIDGVRSQQPSYNVYDNITSIFNNAVGFNIAAGGNYNNISNLVTYGNNQKGIYFILSNYNILTNITINDVYGIRFESAEHNTLRNVYMKNDSYGYGFSIWDSGDRYTGTYTVVDNMTIDGYYYGLYTMNLGGNCVFNNVIINNSNYSFYSYTTPNNVQAPTGSTFNNLSLLNQRKGIYFDRRHNFTFANLLIDGATENGLELYRAQNNSFSNVTIKNTVQKGISLFDSTNNYFNNVSNEFDYQNTNQKFYSDSNQNASSLGNLGWWPTLNDLGTGSLQQAQTAWYGGQEGGKDSDLTPNLGLNWWYENNIGLGIVRLDLINQDDGTLFISTSEIFGLVNITAQQPTLNVNYTWYKNGVLNKTGTYVGYQTKSLTNITSVTDLTVGDTWVLEITAETDSGEIKSRNSTPVIVYGVLNDCTNSFSNDVKYALLSNIENKQDVCFDVSLKNNITIDCQNNKIKNVTSLTNTAKAFQIVDSDNIIITNCLIEDVEGLAIYASQSDEQEYSNIAVNNTKGIKMQDSNNNNINSIILINSTVYAMELQNITNSLINSVGIEGIIITNVGVLLNKSDNNSVRNIQVQNVTQEGMIILDSSNNFFNSNVNEKDYADLAQKVFINSAQNMSSANNTGWWPLLTSNGLDATTQTNTAWYNGTTGGRTAEGQTNSDLKYWYNNKLYSNAPSVDQIQISSTDQNNRSSGYLLSQISTTGYNGLQVYGILDWRINATGISQIILPFNTNPVGATEINEYSQNQLIAKLGQGDGSTSIPDWTSSGRVGGAFNFDGVNDFIEVQNSQLIQNLSRITVEAWIKPDKIGSDDYKIKSIVTKGDFNTFRHFTLVILTNNKFEFFMGDGFNYAGLESSAYAQKNVWQHVVATFNNDTKEIQIYVNGVLDSSTTVSWFTPNFQNTNELRVGWGNSDDFSFDGIIDEVRVYNRILSPEQIKNNYDSGLMSQYSGDLVSQEILKKDNVSLFVTPTDSVVDGSVIGSNNIIIQNTPPILSNVQTTGTDIATSDDIAVSYDVTDSDQDNVYVINDWRNKGVSIERLNLPFNNNISSTQHDLINDYSTFSNHGTLGNGTSGTEPTWTTSGKIGGAYSFDGLNDIIVVDHSSSLQMGSNSWTISSWIKTSSNQQYQGIINAWNGSGYQSTYRLVVYDWVNLGAYGKASFVLYRTNYTDSFSATSTTTVTDGQWHQVVGVKNSTHISIYVDGQKQASTQIPQFDVTLYGNVSIGSGFENGWNFNGTIDEVKMYARALSSEQILADYQAELAGEYSNIISNKETKQGDLWTVQLTPSDGDQDGTSANSQAAQILNVVPTTPTTLTPALDRKTYYNYLNITCSGSTDPDEGDVIQYEIQYGLGSNWNPLATTSGGIFTWDVTNSRYLGVGLRCRSTDGKSYSDWNQPIGTINALRLPTPQNSTLPAGGGAGGVGGSTDATVNDTSNVNSTTNQTQFNLTAVKTSKELKATLTIPNFEKLRKELLKIEVENRQDSDLNDVYVAIEVYNPNSELVETFISQKKKIMVGEIKIYSFEWIPPFTSWLGTYSAKATVFYGDKVLNINKNFKVTDKSFSFGDTTLTNSAKDKVQLNLQINDELGTSLDGVYAEVQIIKDGEIFDTFVLDSTYLSENGQITFPVEFDSTQLEPGEYQMSVKLFYEGKTETKEMPLYVGADEVSLTPLQNGQTELDSAVQVTRTEKSPITLIIAGVLLVILIVIAINKLKNRTKPPKQPPQQPPKQSPQQQTQQKPVAGEVDPYGEQYDLPDLTPPNMS